MKVEWKRILRTTIQVGLGSIITLINTIVNDFSKESIINSVITFATTVLISFFMNVKNEVENNDV